MAAPPEAAGEWADVKRLLGRATGVYEGLPEDVVTRGYTGGPLLGNGEIGVAVGGTDADQTLYIHRQDGGDLALGGVTISARPGPATPLHRYEQDVESSEIRARVTIAGNPTTLRAWVAVHEPLIVVELTNASDLPANYAVQTWAKAPYLAPGAPALLRPRDRGSVALRDADGDALLKPFDYDASVFPAAEEDASRYWELEPAGVEKWRFVNHATRRRLRAGDGVLRLAQAGEAPDARDEWTVRRTYCGHFVQSVAGEGHLTRREDGLVLVDKESREAVWQFEYPNRAFDPEWAGADGLVSWAMRDSERGGYRAAGAIVARVVGAGNGLSEATATVRLAPGQGATVAIAAEGTGGRADAVGSPDEFRDRGRDRVGRLDAAGLERLERERREWWREFWLKSYVDLGDDLLNSYWYGAFHALACAARQGRPEPGLWGPWITTDNPSWGYGNTNNYNHQSPYYGVYSGNRPELAAAYYEGVLYHVPHGVAAAHRAGYEGYIMWRNTGLPGMHGDPPEPAPVAGDRRRDGLPNDQLEVSAFLAINFVNHWRYTLDDVFLKEKAYPFMIACADFYEDYLDLEDGRYVLRESGAREGTGSDLNAGYALAMVELLCRACIDASVALGVDAGRRGRWRDIIERMSNYPTTTADGRTVLREAENRGEVALINNGVGDNASVLQAIFPADGIGLDSDPRLLETARNTIAHMNSDPEKLAWDQGNNFPMIFAQAARVGWDAEELLEQFTRTTRRLLRPNRTVYQFGGGIETCGGTEALHSMLMQSHEGVLRLFPVWPRGRDARLVRLRARGAFLVSAELSGGDVRSLDILSEKGSTLMMENPWPGRRVTVRREVGEATKFEEAEGERLTLSTAPGETLALACPPERYQSLCY
jgi:hypothetical protein